MATYYHYVTWQMPSHVRHRLEQMLGDDYRARYTTLAKEWPSALHSVQLPQTLRWFEDR